MLIIGAAFLWVHQNIVGLCNLFKFVLCVCVWVLVWVVTERQTLVRPSDLLLIRVTWHTEHGVEIHTLWWGRGARHLGFFTHLLHIIHTDGRSLEYDHFSLVHLHRVISNKKMKFLGSWCRHHGHKGSPHNSTIFSDQFFHLVTWIHTYIFHSIQNVNNKSITYKHISFI